MNPVKNETITDIFLQLMGIKMEVRERVYGVDGEKIALIKF